MNDIRRYTKKQIICFLEAINSIEKEEFRRDTISNRIAQADNKAFNKFLKEIDKGE